MSNMIDTDNLTVHEAREMLRKRHVSSVELTRAYLERIEQVEPMVKAMVTVSDELAISQAEEADKLIASGEEGTLCGIPVLVKDNICTRGLRTTCRPTPETWTS